MATLVLSAAGMAAGTTIGGGAFGLASATIGRAAGAMLGRALDQRLVGAGSEAVETGRVDTFRLTGASEGAPMGQVFGRMRVGGQVIWATQFLESSQTSGGGKGAPRGPRTTSYSYSVSLAVAVSEGPILGLGRIWADGQEVSISDLNMRVYTGASDQLPDPKIEAVEGAGEAPAFRGTAYVVFEDLQLNAFGNRVPQFSFEVLRAGDLASETSISEAVKAVALMPGTGEYALATRPVFYTRGAGQSVVVNINSPSAKADLLTSLDTLSIEAPNVQSTSLIVSWFGDDLRCGECTLKPKVEQKTEDSPQMPWVVNGVSRGNAQEVPSDGERVIYGGTPADASVREAIQALKDAGQATLFYPFILMEQLEGNTLPNPYADEPGQPVLPWRGRITLSTAPGRSGSPDRTAQAESEVAAFFGNAQPGDFAANGESVSYSGPAEWSYRRFILHYAHLCASAGGVDAFCIGSEMRALGYIRGSDDSFIAVEALRALAADVRTILGPETKISYAADWSEYFGYQPQDGSGDRYFHLDALWADPAIDFVGIDNYMPLSDWRDGEDHADAAWGSIHNLEYLKSNVAGGEGYDWYYHSIDAREAQIRTPITDDGESEPWVYRYKDIEGWWRNNHHDRINGVRQATPTGWEPMLKPIWFTEFGCAAIDKATNQPNKFLDPKSSESDLPRYSTGRRDDLIQLQYLRAVTEYYEDPANNPVSTVYEAPMIDMTRAHAWAWDARPFPWFPTNSALWSDGENYAKGHWLNGRTVSQPLSAVVEEICRRSGVTDVDTSQLVGLVRGYSIPDIGTGRAALQPLMVAYGFDAVERDGVLTFFNRSGKVLKGIEAETLARGDDDAPVVDHSRDSQAETIGRAALRYVEAGGSFGQRTTEAILPDEPSFTVSQTSMPLALTQSEAKTTVERWLVEARVARDTARFTLPPSQSDVGAGDVVELSVENETALYRVDRIEDYGARAVEAVRIDPASFELADEVEDSTSLAPFVPPTPVLPLYLDLPLLTGDEIEHTPHIAVTASPWPGLVALYRTPTGNDYTLAKTIDAPAVIGVLETPLQAACGAVLDTGAPVRVKLSSGALSSVDMAGLLAGGNLAALGSGEDDAWEVFQFQTATLVDTDTYEISLRLRGQQGSEGQMPAEWPVGTMFVLLTSAVSQVDYPSSLRNVAQTYRVGPSGRPYDDPSYLETTRAFSGAGLRPFAPVHLRADQSGSDIDLSWIRRTRIDGDQWEVAEVPLGETDERYAIRILQGATLIRETTTTAPAWTYSAALQSSDGLSAPFTVEVAQISERFGPGSPARLEIV